METTLTKITAALANQNIQMPIPEFIGAVSNIYHQYEATVYDATQVSLHDAEQSWQAALQSLGPELPQSIRLLDFGAGTGFATLQVLNSSIAKRVKEVVCFDLSPAMIERCREKMKAYPAVSFIFLSDDAGRKALNTLGTFDLVVTNALLHHLLDVEGFLKDVQNWVPPGGFYIAGHEPNHNFYINTELVNATKKFQSYKRIRQRFTLKYWLHKTGIKKSFFDLVALTNDELMKRHMVKSPIPRDVLHKLVDIHVPFGISTDQLWGEVGFEGSWVAERLGKDFVIKKNYTYSHIKDGLANHDIFWRNQVQYLREKFPADGADALMIFKRQ